MANSQVHGDVERTWAEIGDVLGVSEHQARMIGAGALRKLRLHHGARLAEMRELARGKHTRYAIIVP